MNGMPIEYDNIINRLLHYLDDSAGQNYIRGEARSLSRKFDDIERPFYREAGINDGNRKFLSAYNEDGKVYYLYQPTNAVEAFQFFKEVRAPQAFELLKSIFIGKYAGWESKDIIENEVKNIEKFIEVSKSFPIDIALDIQPYINCNAQSEIDYKYVDSSYYAEFRRLQSDFYNYRYLEGDMFSKQARVFALTEYFLPYLKNKVSEFPVPDSVIDFDKLNDNQTFKNGTVAQPRFTRKDVLRAALADNHFFELETVKVLKTEKEDELLSLLVSNGLPYKIAMLDKLGFMKYLYNEYGMPKYKINVMLAGIFNCRDRAVKGNISVLDSTSQENRDRYTAHLYKKTVSTDYQKLK